MANIGRVTAIRGDVKITRGIALYQAHKNLEIEEKDTFFTTKNGSMQITFSDNSVITLGKNSVFKVDEYLYNEKKRDKNKAKFKFRKGFFKSITGRIGKLAPKNFSIKTKNSTIGVRGTEITGTSNDKVENIVCTHGKIVVKSLSTQKEYIAKADEHVEIKLDPKVKYVIATASDILIQNQIEAGIKEPDDKTLGRYIKEEIKVVLKPEVRRSSSSRVLRSILMRLFCQKIPLWLLVILKLRKLKLLKRTSYWINRSLKRNQNFVKRLKTSQNNLAKKS